MFYFQGDMQVKDISDREVKNQPQPPFITSTLQRAASSFLGFHSQQTMSIAQQLYEGTDNPQGTFSRINCL